MEIVKNVSSLKLTKHPLSSNIRCLHSLHYTVHLMIAKNKTYLIITLTMSLLARFCPDPPSVSSNGGNFDWDEDKLQGGITPVWTKVAHSIIRRDQGWNA